MEGLGLGTRACVCVGCRFNARVLVLIPCDFLRLTAYRVCGCSGCCLCVTKEGSVCLCVCCGATTG
jgi:hypothetical protein